VRTLADLQATAARTGCRLVRTRTDGRGNLVGEFECPDVDEGKPLATAIMLEGLTDEDSRVDVFDPAILEAAARAPSPAAFLHAFVQSAVEFTPEDVETFQTPSVTLATGKGDCDDSARALVALARAIGVKGRLVFFLQEGQPAHVAAQLQDAAAPSNMSGGMSGAAPPWRWAETTIAARFGEHPFQALERLGGARSDLSGAAFTLQDGQAVPLPTTMQGLGSMSSVPSYIGDSFAQDLVTFAQSIGADPLDLLKLLLSESGLQPSSKHPGGFASGQYAVGINQFAPVNWHYFAPLSAAAYAALTADQQLPYVEQYFTDRMREHGISSASGADLYWLNYLPATFVPGATDFHVIVTSSSGFYTNNKSLDHGGKGFITKGDLQLSLDAQPAGHPTLWPLLSQQILQIQGGPNLPVAAALITGAIFLGAYLADADTAVSFLPAKLASLFS
jgi:hypothetical protein